jgi:hypothetical protein
MKIKKLMDLEMIFIILSALVTGGLAINAHVSSKKKESELVQKTEQIVNLQNELREKSGELIQTQKEMLLYNSGGDSYSYMILGDFTKTTALTKVANQGEYPLYDLEFYIVDVDLLEQAEKRGLVAQHQGQIWTSMKVGNLQPKRITVTGTLNLGTSNERKFNILFTARNGVFKQQIVLRRKNEKWFVAWSLSDSKDKIIDHKMADGFLNDGETEYKFRETPIGELAIGPSQQ